MDIYYETNNLLRKRYIEVVSKPSDTFASLAKKYIESVIDVSDILLDEALINKISQTTLSINTNIDTILTNNDINQIVLLKSSFDSRPFLLNSFINKSVIEFDNRIMTKERDNFINLHYIKNNESINLNFRRVIPLENNTQSNIQQLMMQLYYREYNTLFVLEDYESLNNGYILDLLNGFKNNCGNNSYFICNKVDNSVLNETLLNGWKIQSSNDYINVLKKDTENISNDNSNKVVV